MIDEVLFRFFEVSGGWNVIRVADYPIKMYCGNFRDVPRSNNLFGVRYSPEHIFQADSAEKFSIAIMRCQLMKRQSDNYPTICMYMLQNF